MADANNDLRRRINRQQRDAQRVKQRLANLLKVTKATRDALWEDLEHQQTAILDDVITKLESLQH